MAARDPWHNGTVTVASPHLQVALVARRHIDLMRVCSCSCLPWRRRPAHLLARMATDLRPTDERRWAAPPRL